MGRPRCSDGDGPPGTRVCRGRGSTLAPALWEGTDPNVLYEGRQQGYLPLAPLPYGEMPPCPPGAVWPLSPMPTPVFGVCYKPFHGQRGGCLGSCFYQSLCLVGGFCSVPPEHTIYRVAPNLPLPFLSWSLFTKQRLRAAIYLYIHSTFRVAKQAKPK